MASSIANWLKELAPWRAAGGVLIMVGLACFSFGAATNHLMSQVRDVPGRVGVLEVEAIERDSVSAVWRSGSEEEWLSFQTEWRSFFVIDSIYKAETNCLFRRLIEGLPVDRYDCKPETGDS